MLVIVDNLPLFLQSIIVKDRGSRRVVFYKKMLQGEAIEIFRTLFKKRPWHRCFRMTFANCLRTPFLQNTPVAAYLKTSNWIFSGNWAKSLKEYFSRNIYTSLQVP